MFGHESDRGETGHVRMALVAAVVIMCGFALHVHAANEPQVDIQKLDGKLRVSVDGELFTEYIYEGHPKPFLYPVKGPYGMGLTRDFPMNPDVEGDAHDHDHHKSLWFAQDKVNGVRFWAEEGRIVQDELISVSDGETEASFTAKNKWLNPDGKPVCTDTRTISFTTLPEGRVIDWKITLHASHGDLKIGDTKEGTMAIRTHPNLRLTNDSGRGVTTANGKAFNSQGTRGRELWGQRASWVDYWGKIKDKTVGVAIFDHPTNPRHPTWWHARHYGLIAANPFGLHYFEDMPAGAGDMKIPEGESVTFRYRFVFHKGDFEEADVAKLYRDYAAGRQNIPDNYELVYWQPFNDESAINDFEFTDPSGWKFATREMNGCMETTGKSSYKPEVRSPRIIALLSDHTFGDFILEADLLQTGKEYGHRDMCLFYGFQDPSNYYYTHIATQTDPHAHNIFIVDDEPRTKISTKTTEGVDWGQNEWHHVRLERDVSEGTIKVYYDDMSEPIMLANDKTFKEGYIGFGTFDDQGRVDNIEVWAPKMKNKPSDFFETK